MKSIVYSGIVCAFLIGSQLCAQTNGMLVFLDDSERTQMGSPSRALLLAILQEAGPILASASVIANIRPTDLPKEKDPEKLLSFFNTNDPLVFNQKDYVEEVKKIILSIASFDNNLAQRWVIKEINPFLYLLLPKKYLESKGMRSDDVEAFSIKGSATELEQVLGLKVNHLKTVMAADIKTPSKQFLHANYFIPALDAIFLTNKEYYSLDKNNTAPSWVFYLMGHGSINNSIAHLNLVQFKELLNFLEHKIKTKLFVYSSCYAAGINAEKLYKDAQKGVDKSYPFAIVVQSLGDAISISLWFGIGIENGKLAIKTPPEFKNFVPVFKNFLDMALNSDVINYRELVAPLVPNLTQLGLGSLPQIRFPGLSWFSILDDEKVISIGSIMAKTRTKPLDIATFFKKRDPLGILLYAHSIPFELICSTKNMPTIISMIPGNAVHQFKKISSGIHSADTIINSFLTIPDLAPRKIFIINDLTAPAGNILTKQVSGTATLSNVVIIQDSARDFKMRIYFKYKGSIYYASGGKITDTNPVVLANEEMQKFYAEILQVHGLDQSSTTISDFEGFFEKNTAILANPITAADAQKIIENILDAMPDNMVLHIPKINSAKGQNDMDWYGIFDHLAEHESGGIHKPGYPLKGGNNKILWIDSIETSLPSGQIQTIYRDIIIDGTRNGIGIFYREDSEDFDYLGTKVLSDSGQYYVPVYKEIFDYFQKNKTLPGVGIEKQPVQELLTPEAVMSVQEVQEKKIIKQKQGEKKE